MVFDDRCICASEAAQQQVAHTSAVLCGLLCVCRVHTLVTLGTPHTSAEPVTRRNIDYVNEHYNCMEDIR